MSDLDMSPMSSRQSEGNLAIGSRSERDESLIKRVLRWILALLFVAAGTLHFARPDFYTGMIPPVLPWPVFWVIFTGAAEIAGGIGLLVPTLRQAAAIGLIAMLLGFLWVHVRMLWEPPVINGQTPPMWLLWARLPLQFVLIGWVWWVGRRPGDAVTPDRRPSPVAG